MQTLKKTGSRMPLRMKKAVLVHSNYIPRTFNPCGDVTVSYLLWAELDDYIATRVGYHVHYANNHVHATPPQEFTMKKVECQCVLEGKDTSNKAEKTAGYLDISN